MLNNKEIKKLEKQINQWSCINHFYKKILRRVPLTPRDMAVQISTWLFTKIQILVLNFFDLGYFGLSYFGFGIL